MALSRLECRQFKKSFVMYMSQRNTLPWTLLGMPGMSRIYNGFQDESSHCVENLFPKRNHLNSNGSSLRKLYYMHFAREKPQYSYKLTYKVEKKTVVNSTLIHFQNSRCTCQIQDASVTAKVICYIQIKYQFALHRTVT